MELNSGNIPMKQKQWANVNRSGCPQIKDFEWIKTLFPPYASQPRDYPFDDLKCTNLNVTFPATVLEQDLKGLPVMVYIHGIHILSKQLIV
jgi:carboxylesterase type B